MGPAIASLAAMGRAPRRAAKGKKRADNSDQPEESHQDENQDASVEQAESQGENPQGSEVSRQQQLRPMLFEEAWPRLALDDVSGVCKQDTQQDENGAPEGLAKEEEKLRNEREAQVQALKVSLVQRARSLMFSYIGPL